MWGFIIVVILALLLIAAGLYHLAMRHLTSKRFDACFIGNGSRRGGPDLTVQMHQTNQDITDDLDGGYLTDSDSE